MIAAAYGLYCGLPQLTGFVGTLMARLKVHPAWQSAIEAAKEGDFDETIGAGCRQFTWDKCISRLRDDRTDYTDLSTLVQNTDTLVKRCASCGILEPKKGAFKKCSACAEALPESDVPSYCSAAWCVAIPHRCPAAHAILTAYG